MVCRRAAAVVGGCVLILGAGGCAARNPAGSHAPGSLAPLPPEETPADDPEPTGAPEGWSVKSINGTEFRIAIPPGWGRHPVSEMRNDMAARLVRMSGETRARYAKIIDLFDSGRVRFVARGPSTIAPSVSSVSVIVDTGDASLDDAVARIENLLTGNLAIESRQEAVINLPIGSGKVIITTSHVPDAEPTRNVRYILFLRDGTTLTVAGTSRTEDEAFVGLMSRIASSISLTR
jgi:hypothetical protein